MPLSELPGDAPAAQMFEACIKCTAGNAKPVDAVLKSDGGDDAWPGASLVDLACAILQMLASRGWSVGVTPMCIVTTAVDDTTVQDLAALEHVLRVFQVAGKVGRLLA